MKSYCLSTNWLGKRIQVLEEVDSTNRYCKEHFGVQDHGTVVLARRQKAGKGSHGRNWVDAGEEGVTLSLVFAPPAGLSLASCTLLTALALTVSLQDSGVNASIKWPNDLVLSGRKMAGILTEGVTFGEKIILICGVGINRMQTEGWFANAGLPNGGSILTQTGKRIPEQELVCGFLYALEPLYERWIAAGFTELLRREYSRRCITLNRVVEIWCDGRLQEGYAVRIASDGGLVCRLDGEERVFYGSQAAVRGVIS